MVVGVCSLFVTQQTLESDSQRIIEESTELRADDAHLALEYRQAANRTQQHEAVAELLRPVTTIVGVVAVETQRDGGNDADFSRWTLSVEPTKITQENLATFSENISQVVSNIEQSDQITRGLTQQGSLLAQIELVHERIEHLALVSRVAQILFAATACLALGAFARRIISERRNEEKLLLARGMSPKSATILVCAEGLGVSTFGAIVGAGLGYLVLGLLDSESISMSRSIPQAITLIAITVILASTLVAVIAARNARELSTIQPEQNTQIELTAQQLTSIAIGVAAIGVGLWRLAVVPETPDLLSYVAPTLLIFGIMAVGMAMLPTIFAVAMRRTNVRTTTSFLAQARIARDTKAFAIPTLTVGLAIAGIVLGAQYVGIANDNAIRQTIDASGSDLRLSVQSTAPLTADEEFTAYELQQTTQTEAGSPVDPAFVTKAEVTFASHRSTVLASTWSNDHPGYALPPQLKELETTLASLGSAETAAELRLTLPSADDSLGLNARVILADSTGALVSVGSGWSRTPLDSKHTQWVASLPPGIGQWNLVGAWLTSTAESSESSDAPYLINDLSLSLTTGDTIIGLSALEPSEAYYRQNRSTAPDQYELERDGSLILAVPYGASGLEVVITQDVAQLLGVSNPTSSAGIEMRIGAATLPVAVQDVVVQLPGGKEPGVAVHSLSLARAQLLHDAAPTRASEIWWRTNSSGSLNQTTIQTAHDNAAAVLKTWESANITTPLGVVTQANAHVIPPTLPPQAAIIFITMMLGICALTATALLTSLSLIAEARTREMWSLRALGMGLQQVTIRRIELTWILACATILGAIGGGITALASARMLGASTSLTYALDPRTLVLGLTTLVVCVALIVYGYNRRLRNSLNDYSIRGGN